MTHMRAEAKGQRAPINHFYDDPSHLQANSTDEFEDGGCDQAICAVTSLNCIIRPRVNFEYRQH